MYVIPSCISVKKSEIFKLKNMNYDGQPGACSFRLRPKKGSNHIGSTVRGLFLHFCKSLFLGFEPVTSWSQGRRCTTATRLPFQKYELWWNLNLEFGGLRGGHGGRAPTPNFPYKCPKYCHCIEHRCMKDGGNSLCLFCHIIRAKGRRFLRSVKRILYISELWVLLQSSKQTMSRLPFSQGLVHFHGWVFRGFSNFHV